MRRNRLPGQRLPPLREPALPGEHLTLTVLFYAKAPDPIRMGLPFERVAWRFECCGRTSLGVKHLNAAGASNNSSRRNGPIESANCTRFVSGTSVRRKRWRGLARPLFRNRSARTGKRLEGRAPSGEATGGRRANVMNGRPESSRMRNSKRSCNRCWSRPGPRRSRLRCSGSNNYCGTWLK